MSVCRLGLITANTLDFTFVLFRLGLRPLNARKSIALTYPGGITNVDMYDTSENLYSLLRIFFWRFLSN